MKRSLPTALILLLFCLPMQAQYFQQGPLNFSELHPDSAMRLHPQASRMEFAPGEIIVRFKDHVQVSADKSLAPGRLGLASVDQLLEGFGITEAGQLIPGARPLVEKQLLTLPTGEQIERPSLHNIFLLKAQKQDGNLYEVIDALKEHPDVLYAEPNYIYRLVGHTVDSDVISPEALGEYLQQQAKEDGSYTPNDPLFGQQHWISTIGVDQVWEQVTGDENQVIAILDTGVDWNHPDLKNKIWQNPGEVLDGRDSNGNGFVDDIRGWDFINHRNNPMDDNSHGTHVAGIAAAETDNGIGIAGVSRGARIMPVKVLQSSGSGTAAVIVQGINYAAQNGATVINMSFGGYGLSLAMRDALANAYATAVLVAAAGNDGICIGPIGPCAPMFPAAFSFVLGVEANALFSNFDQDGPVFSGYQELYNYEITAPGAGIISAIPGGNYRFYSGTSMAAPLVAGCIALYRTIHPDHSQETMWVNMIHRSGSVFNLPAALEGIDVAQINFVSHHLKGNNNNYGKPDAGETIELWVKLRNTGAQARNVMAGIRLVEFEDVNVAQILSENGNIGNISSYASKSNETDPFIIKIGNNVAHNRQIVFELFAYEEGTNDTIRQSLTLEVNNAIKVGGLITGNITWTNKNLYLVTSNIAVPAGSKLTIEPGTIIRFDPDLLFVIDGQLEAAGKKDSLIVFTSNIDHYLYEKIIIRGPQSNAVFDQEGKLLSGTLFNYVLIENARWGIEISNSSPAFRNSIIYSSFSGQGEGEVTQCNVTGIGYNGSGFNFESVKHIRHNNIFNNHYTHDASYGVGIYLWNSILEYNNIYLNPTFDIFAGGDINETIEAKNNWFGTTDPEKISERIYDYSNDFHRAIVNFQPFLLKPDALAPGIVWKVLVNGADAQDEYVEPVGVGPQRFDVYFNRAMDTDYPPMLTFGVRYPYTQQAVADSAFWSADSTVYTAYKTIQLFTGDGINTIRVAGARDPEHFEIPIEDSRFSFLIDAAGAASAGFMATPGMGRIGLEWDDPGEVDDLMGYNLYRFSHITDTTFSPPVLLNRQLVLEPGFTDFEVEPGQRYYYYYKILRTNMAETDSSRVVSAIPHTAAPGDANGDYHVNVLDIVSMVDHMLGKKPQPFIFEAADVNLDGLVNVLDMVGVIALINAKGQKQLASLSQLPPATIWLDNERIRLESQGQVSALQFEMTTAFPELVEISSLLPGFELAWIRTDTGIRGVLFSMQGNTIPKGMTDILGLSHSNPDLDWAALLGAGQQGQPVEIRQGAVGIDEKTPLPMVFELNVYPNPARDHFTIGYFLPVLSDVELRFYDLQGRELQRISQGRRVAGRHSVGVAASSLGGTRGLVFCRITAVGANGEMIQKTVKLIIQDSGLHGL